MLLQLLPNRTLYTREMTDRPSAASRYLYGCRKPRSTLPRTAAAPDAGAKVALPLRSIFYKFVDFHAISLYNHKLACCYNVR
jgi:hypothetical protein